MSDYEAALATANLTIQQVKNLIRSTVKALEDKKLSGSEYMRLGLQSTQLGIAIIVALEDTTPEERKDLLYVLGHSSLTMEDT